MFAVFESGGKQRRVSEGDVVRLETLAGKPAEDDDIDPQKDEADTNDLQNAAPNQKNNCNSHKNGLPFKNNIDLNKNDGNLNMIAI